MIMEKMTIEEYKEQLKVIEEECTFKRKKLLKEYALRNNPYKVNDIISDGRSSIKIQKIQFYFFGMNTERPSECVYVGPELKTNGDIKKKRGLNEPVIGSIYQSNIKTQNNA